MEIEFDVVLSHMVTFEYIQGIRIYTDFQIVIQVALRFPAATLYRSEQFQLLLSLGTILVCVKP